MDTGADYSLVSAKLATLAGLFIDSDATVPTLLTATGQAVGVVGTVCGRMNVGSYKIARQNLIVMEEMSEGLDIILGLNWMREHGVILDLAMERMIIVGKNKCKTDYKEQSSKRIVFERDFFLLPGAKCKTKNTPLRTVAALQTFLDSSPDINFCMGYVKVIDGELWMQGTQFDEHNTAHAQRLCSMQQSTDTPLPIPKAPDPSPVMHQEPFPEPLSPDHDQCDTPVPSDKVVHNDPSVPLLPDEIQQILFQYWELFEPMKPGVTDKFQYPFSAIELSDLTPKFSRMYRLCPAEAAECANQINNFLANGWIRESKSPYGAPILFAAKPGGALRLCIDFRMINKVTTRNRYPLPIIQDVLDQLSGSAVFTSLDLVQGYHQIALLEQDIPKTAFRTPLGHYECLVLWEGLTNAPSIFQGIMANILRPVLGKFAVLYIDDILIFSKTEEEHAQHVAEVLALLAKAKLHLKLAKCKFAQPELKFLGHVITKEGTSMDPAKVKGVADFPQPTTTVEIQCFVGMCNYFSRYIKDYATMARPLTSIQNLKGPWPDGHWGTEQTQAFERLKHAIQHDVLLKLPDMKAALTGTSPFQVVIDASQEGMGGVLLQGGRPVAFYSRQFSSCERKFGTGDREMCAVIFALKTWRCYLEGVEFELFTDHEPLTYFESISQLDRRKAGYVEFLSRFSFSWTHIKGNLNVVADCLSRSHDWSESTAPQSSDLSDGLHIINMIHEHLCGVQFRGMVCGSLRSNNKFGCDDPRVDPKHSKVGYEKFPQGHMQLDTAGKAVRLDGSFLGEHDAMVDDHPHPPPDVDMDAPPQPYMVPHPRPVPQCQHPTPSQPPVAPQEKPDPLPLPLAIPDRFLNPLVAKILLGYSVDPQFKSRLFTKDLKRTATGLFLKPIPVDELLLANQHGRDCHSAVIMVPNAGTIRRDIIKACHDAAYSGHRGVEGTLDLVRRDFWWEGMTADVKEHVRVCTPCQLYKTDHTRPYGLAQPLSIPTRRFGSWSMDMIVSLPRTPNGFDAVLVVVCRLCKYTWFIPCKTAINAEQCAQLVFDNVAKYVGLPDEIVSDRDSRFATGHFARALWAIYGINQATSTAYHPQSDGQTERMNKTLHEYIRSYIGPSHANWAAHLSMAQFALNNSYSPSIGASPFYFVLGFHPKTPHTHLLTEDCDANPDAATFALERNADLLAAQQCLSRAQARMKIQYDKNRLPLRLEVGQEVLLSTRNLRLKGCAKYLPRFVGPFTVHSAVGSRGNPDFSPNAYRLNLPHEWNIHPVFNVNILKPYNRAGPGLKHLHPLPTLLDDYSYVIESIVTHELEKSSLHRLRYRVHLHDTPAESDMWEDESVLAAQCPALLQSYKLQHSL